MPLSLPLAHIRTRVSCFHSPTANPQRLLRPAADAFQNPEQSGAPKMGFTRHPHGGTESSLAFCLASAAVSMPPYQRTAAFYPMSEPPHPPLWTMAPVTAGTATVSTPALPVPYSAMTEPFDVIAFTIPDQHKKFVGCDADFELLTAAELHNMYGFASQVSNSKAQINRNSEVEVATKLIKEEM